MHRVTRPHTVARRLTEGGFVRLEIAENQQKTGPNPRGPEGFAVRNHVDPAGTLLTVVGAYGADWYMTLAQIRYRLERPYVKCTVTDDDPALADHELLVSWATAAELQSRTQAENARQAPLRALLRRQAAEQQAEDDRKAMEAAGQGGLF